MEPEQVDSPPVYLPVGTEVSAKFKGAFCEARITKLVKLVKIKVQLKDASIITVEESAIQGGRLEINQNVELRHMKQSLKGQIICIKDCSSYTVIFNDGDERILKRTKLCQKGEKHFKEAETLDKLPLYHPDKRLKKKKEEEDKNSARFPLVSPSSQQSPRHFRSSSVTPLKGIASTRSATRAIARLQFEESERSASAAADCFPDGLSSNLLAKSSSLSPQLAANSVETDPESEELIRYDQPSCSTAADVVVERPAIDEHHHHLAKEFPSGVAVLINAFTPPKFGGRLGMIVSQEEFRTQCKTPVPILQIEANQVPFRSFQNGRYNLTSFDRLSKFDPVETRRLTDFGSMGLKVAFERANSYVTRGELPQSWTRKPSDAVDLAKKKLKKAEKVSDSSSSEDDDSAYNERRDLCVAHFYKFQDESGNQLNRVPLLGGKEIDIYRIYDVVSRMGGHKRVTQESGWRRVLRKLHLEDTGVSPTTVKNSYIRYFEKFESFMKNLGYSSLTVAASTPSANPRNTRMIRGYNSPHDSKLSEQKKKARPKEQRMPSDRGQSISKEASDSVIKSRSASIASAKAASPAVIAAALRNDEQQRKSLEAMPSNTTTIGSDAEFIIAHDEAATFDTTHQQQKTELHEETAESVVDKLTEANLKSSTLLENLEMDKKRTGSQESTTWSRSTSTEGSLTTNKKETSLPKHPKSTRGRRPKIPRDQRTKSPSGHQAVLEDIGYTNAHIFTRFYQGQNVHARHHLRFYDARVIMVNQPTLCEVAKSLSDALEEQSVISNQMSLTDLTYENMGDELRKTLRNLMMSTKIFVHYLGWNSRYDEWLMLHKIRVDEKDENCSAKALGQLVPDQLAPQLLSVAMDWCRSAEGIASLATIPSAQSCEQRPRRLSAATLAKTNTNLVRKCNEVMPSVEETAASTTYRQDEIEDANKWKNIADKQPNQKCPLQFVGTTKVVPQEMGGAFHSSTATNCIYSAPPLPPKVVTTMGPTRHHQQQQQTNMASTNLLTNSTKAHSSPSRHVFVTSPSKYANIEQSSLPANPVVVCIKNDSEGRTSHMTMAPYSIVVKTAQSSDYAHAMSASLCNKTTNILMSPKRPDKEDKNGTLDIDDAGSGPAHHLQASSSQPTSTEVAVSIQSHFTKVDMSKAHHLQAETTIFVHGASSGCCAFSAKSPSNGERKAVVVGLQAPCGGVHSLNVSEQVVDSSSSSRTLDKEEPKHTVHLQHSQHCVSKKRTAPVASGAANGGGKAPIDPTQTEEDDEGMAEGTHSASIHSVRQRVMQKMEDEHIYDSYAFVGLSELDDELEKCVHDPDEQVRLIEGRMRELREIYHKYKGKLTDLEKEHKKRQRHEKTNARKMVTTNI
uniref:ARID domain-containing protein n=1 Tax=Globodera rostochiensis TaxID=31243 RepID=A0A914HAC4_GLORO